MQNAGIGRGRKKDKDLLSSLDVYENEQCKKSFCKFQSATDNSLVSKPSIGNSIWTDASYKCVLKFTKSPEKHVPRSPFSNELVPLTFSESSNICDTTPNLKAYDFPSMHKSTRPKDGYSKKMECFKGSDKADSSLSRKHSGVIGLVEGSSAPAASKPLNGKATSLMHETEEFVKVNETGKLCLSGKRQSKDLGVRSSQPSDHLQISKAIEDSSDHRNVQLNKGVSGFDVNGNLAFDTAKSEGSIETAFNTPISHSSNVDIVCDATKSDIVHAKLNKQSIATEKPVNPRNILFDNAGSKSELVCSSSANKFAFPSSVNTKSFTGCLNEVVSSRRLPLSPEIGKNSDPLLKLVHLQSSRIDSNSNQQKGALYTNIDSTKRVNNQGNCLEIESQHDKNLNLDTSSGSDNLKRLFSSAKPCFLPKEVAIKDTVIESKASNFSNNFSLPTDKGSTVKRGSEFIKPQFKQQTKKSELKEPQHENYGECRQPAAGSFSDKMIFPALPTHCFQRETADSSLNKSTINKSCESIDLEDLQSISVGERVDGQLPNFSASTATPSNPQASYADVIRMPPPLGKISPQQGTMFSENKCEDSVQFIENTHHGKIQKKDDIQPPGSSKWILSRLAQFDIKPSAPASVNIMLPPSNQNGKDPVNTRAIVVSFEKPSFYNSGLTNKNSTHSSGSLVNIHSTNKLSDDDRGLIDYKVETVSPSKENEKELALVSQYANDLDNLPNQRLGVTINATVDSLSSNPSSISSSICEAYKCAGSSSSNGDSLDPKMKRPPVIFMDNCVTSGGMPEISFGIDSEELIKLFFDDSILSDMAAVGDNTFAEISTNDSAFKINSIESELPVSKVCAEASVQGGNYCDQKLSKIADSDCSNITSLDIGGKIWCWKDAEVNTESSGVAHIVHYLSETWKSVEKDCKKENGKNEKYYTDA